MREPERYSGFNCKYFVNISLFSVAKSDFFGYIVEGVFFNPHSGEVPEPEAQLKTLTEFGFQTQQARLSVLLSQFVHKLESTDNTAC